MGLCGLQYHTTPFKYDGIQTYVGNGGMLKSLRLLQLYTIVTNQSTKNSVFILLRVMEKKSKVHFGSHCYGSIICLLMMATSVDGCEYGWSKLNYTVELIEVACQTSTKTGRSKPILIPT